MVVVCKPFSETLMTEASPLNLYFVPGPYIKLIEMIKLQQQAGAELCQPQDKFS